MQLRSYLQNALHLFYPHLCCGCGSDILPENEMLCIKCIAHLPFTQFESIEGNSIEKIFYGRVKIESAYSLLYFSRHQLVQQLIHQFKYGGNKKLGEFLGQIMGYAMQKSKRFAAVEILVPLPLNDEKVFKRGFNQAEILCKGMQQVTGLPIADTISVTREKYTETQTKKHRVERWQNVEDSFAVHNPGLLQNKHVLIVDDVITTGATLESCATAMQHIEAVTISIATLAIASK